LGPDHFTVRPVNSAVNKVSVKDDAIEAADTEASREVPSTARKR
jgi:hypothetical protein